MQTENNSNLSPEQEVRLRLISFVLSNDPFYSHTIVKNVANRYTDYVITGETEKIDVSSVDNIIEIRERQTKISTMSVMLLVVQFVLLVATVIVKSIGS